LVFAAFRDTPVGLAAAVDFDRERIDTPVVHAAIAPDASSDACPPFAVAPLDPGGRTGEAIHRSSPRPRRSLGMFQDSRNRTA